MRFSGCATRTSLTINQVWSELLALINVEFAKTKKYFLMIRTYTYRYCSGTECTLQCTRNCIVLLVGCWDFCSFFVFDSLSVFSIACLSGKRLYTFFSTLYAALSRGSRAVFQFYPENSAQVSLSRSYLCSFLCMIV